VEGLTCESVSSYSRKSGLSFFLFDLIIDFIIDVRQTLVWHHFDLTSIFLVHCDLQNTVE
jgi:hypothetical protein